MERNWTYSVFVVIYIGFLFLSYKSIPKKHDGSPMKQLTDIVTTTKSLHQTMVSVSHPNCRKLFQIEGFHQQKFPQGGDQNIESLYMRLSEELPPTAVDQGLMTPTRLQNGQYVKVDLQFMVTKKTLNGMRVVSTDGLMQIDFVGATRGVRFWSNKGGLKKINRNKPISLLRQWTTKPEDIPHLIVIGHGLWSFMQLYVSFLAPFDDVLKEWRQTAEFLVSLSARTSILVWKQSRKRDFATLDHLKGKQFKMENILKNYVLSKQAMKWIDYTMQSVLDSSGLTVWDSSTPMNVANIRECAAIREVLHGGYKDYYNQSEKGKPQNDIRGSVNYGQTSGDNEYKEDIIDFRRIYQSEGTKNEDAARKNIPEGELIEKITQLNIKMNSNETNTSLERKQKRDNNSAENINIRYNMLLRKLLDNSLDLRGTHKLKNTENDNFNTYNDDTPYNNYIDYVLDVLQTMPFQDLETLYNSYVLNCRDGVHNSELTMQDETDMIYNLLCNQYDAKQDDLCCQI